MNPRLLREELYASRGAQLYNHMLSQQITFYTFEQNYRELDAFVRLHYQLQAQRKLGDFNNPKPLHDFLYELTRRLQNFVFSAKALVDHTRNYMERAHGERPEIGKAYELEKAKHFVVSGIGGFTKGLRDFFAHCSTPFLSSVLGGPGASLRERFTLQLDTEEMSRARASEFHGWSSAAKKYISAHGGCNIDLGIYVTDYYEAVRRFYSWLDDHNEEWCRVAWEHTLALQDQLEKPVTFVSHD
jgi:hypothetical protein